MGLPDDSDFALVAEFSALGFREIKVQFQTKFASLFWGFVQNFTVSWNNSGRQRGRNIKPFTNTSVIGQKTKMKNPLILLAALMVLLNACNKDDDDVLTAQENTPVVKQTAAYAVNFEADIVYAEGLSHDSLNSTNSTAIPLKLNVYSPINEAENRPLFMFIHGGAFANGSKQDWGIRNIADFYASRGWVFVSIDYRLLDDQGTVPAEWSNYASSLPISAEDAASFNAMYPAQRDAKAALRWIVAHKDNYNINTDYITVGGASAGANTAKAIAVSGLDDFTAEIDLRQDPTLSSTNLDQVYQIQTIVDFWGGQSVTDAFEAIYGINFFDQYDPPLYKAHGTADSTVPFSSALELKEIYESIGVVMKLDTLHGAGHGNFNATLDGKRVEELAFDFIVVQQNLVVE
ncbi:MAG: alpha/beta hydrolase [Bacteroidota bacterium]